MLYAKTVGGLLVYNIYRELYMYTRNRTFSQCQQQILYQFVILNNLLYKVYVYKYGINFFVRFLNCFLLAIICLLITQLCMCQ